MACPRLSEIGHSQSTAVRRGRGSLAIGSFDVWHLDEEGPSLRGLYPWERDPKSSNAIGHQCVSTAATYRGSVMCRLIASLRSICSGSYL